MAAKQSSGPSSAWMTGSGPEMTDGGMARAVLPALDIEEHGLLVALHVDVEAVDGNAAMLLARRDQRGAPLRRHREQHRIALVRRLVREVDAGVEVGQQAAHEDDDVDVRRLLVVDRAGLHGVEHEAVLRIGAGAAAPEAPERDVAARVSRVGVASLRVGLPDLDHGVVDRRALAVQHAAPNADALALDVGSAQIRSRSDEQTTEPQSLRRIS